MNANTSSSMCDSYSRRLREHRSSKQKLALVVFLVAACSSTIGSSFVLGPPQQCHPISYNTLHATTATIRQRVLLRDTAESVDSPDVQEDNVSENNNSETENDDENNNDETDDDQINYESSSSSSSNLLSSNLHFDDVAESSAPPLNYEKYLTMQKKRVCVTIKYSKEYGLKPYYLTVAKKVKDEYPDVSIESIPLSSEDKDTEGSDSGGEDKGTFEVRVDGKIVIRNQKGSKESIFVSMSEMEHAIARARKRRRPSTVYGEKGTLIVDGNATDKEQLVKARLAALKHKADAPRTDDKVTE